MNKKLKTSLLRSLFGIISCFIVINCTWAAGVPKYNSNDPNPKPGLYYVGETHNYGSYSIVLKDGRVLILACGTNNRFLKTTNLLFSKAEIFDPKTAKFKKLPNMKYQHSAHDAYGGKIQTLLLKDGRVLISAGLISHPGFSVYNAEMYEIFDPAVNDFHVLGKSKICRYQRYYNGKAEFGYHITAPYLLRELSDGKVAAYCSRLNGTDKTGKYDFESEMEIIDTKNNTISEPIKKGAKNYILPPKKPLEKFIIQDVKDAYAKLQKKKNPNAILSKNQKELNFSRFKLDDTKYLIISNYEADYGIMVADLDKNSTQSWFSPIYEYNVKTKELVEQHEYLRSFTGNITHLNNANKMLITNGKMPAYFTNQNSDPKYFSLYKRIIIPRNLMEDSRKVYIYVY